MPADPHPSPEAAPDHREPELDALIARARGALRDTQELHSTVTGGAAPRAILAEVAHGLAAELAGHFDELPMHLFVARVPPSAVPWNRLLPGRRLAHRIVLGRYLTATPPHDAGVGYVACSARISVAAVGVDGVLRCGVLWETIVLPREMELSTDPLAWNDMRLRSVPSRAIRMRRWTGSAEPVDVAAPYEMLAALTRVAESLAAELRRDLTTVRRLLDPRPGGAADKEAS